MSGSTKLMTAGGGGVSLTPASSIASDVTVNVPSQNCTLGIQGPAFSAYKTNLQSVTLNTWTKIQYETEEFDTASCYDNSTNYRFTPNVAGYYSVTARTEVQATNTTTSISVYKNGSDFKRGVAVVGSAGSSSTVAALIYCNGSTDYLEVYWYTGVTQSTEPGASRSYFQASLARAA